MPNNPCIISCNDIHHSATNEQLLLDVRPYNDFAAGHIPGAIHFDLSQANASQPPTHGLLPDESAFAHYLSELGIKQDSHLIIYDQQGGPPAGRALWTLATFGHAQVSMLNGGITSWLIQQLPLIQQTEMLKPSKYSTILNPDYYADRHYILSKINHPNTVLLDVRTEPEFNGIDIRSSRGGHIPGAINLNWLETKDLSLTTEFKPENTLINLLEDKNIDRNKEIIVYCQTHQRSAIMWVLLKQLAYQNIKGYPGGWSDWGNSENTPIEKS